MPKRNIWTSIWKHYSAMFFPTERSFRPDSCLGLSIGILPVCLRSYRDWHNGVTVLVPGSAGLIEPGNQKYRDSYDWYYTCCLCMTNSNLFKYFYTVLVTKSKYWTFISSTIWLTPDGAAIRSSFMPWNGSYPRLNIWDLIIVTLTTRPINIRLKSKSAFIIVAAFDPWLFIPDYTIFRWINVVDLLLWFEYRLILLIPVIMEWLALEETM